MTKRQSAQISSVRPEVRRWLYDTSSQTTREAFVSTLEEATRCLHAEPGYRITHPLLLRHGERDGTGNIRKAARTWARRDPICRYVVIPDAGHAANLDNPQAFNQTLLAFLSEVLDGAQREPGRK